MKIKRKGVYGQYNSALRRCRQRSCLATKKKKMQGGDRETERKGEGEGKRKTGTFAYMVIDYGGTKGPRALGPLFLEDASLVLSSTPSFFFSTPSPTLQRTPNYLCLHISPLSPSRLLLPSSLLSLSPRPSSSCMHYAFEDRVITVDYAVAPSLPFREKDRESSSPRTVRRVDEKA